MPTALEDAKEMGYVAPNGGSGDPPSSESSPTQKKISYREALANGMWRVRTAPLVFYVGDSALQVTDSILHFPLIFS
jgi:hypothetical protein